MTILEIHKLNVFQEPQYLRDLLKLECNNLTRRNNRIHVPFFKLSHYQNNFCYQAPELWNLIGSNSNICNDVIGAPSLKSMKSRLKFFLLKIQAHGQPQSESNDNNWHNFNRSIAAYINLMKS